MRRQGVGRLAGCFTGVCAATVAVGLEDSNDLIWIANGLLLSYLLLAPRWRWMHYLILGFAAMLAGGILVAPGNWSRCIALTLVNIIEVVIAAFLLHRRSTQLPRFTDQHYILRFIAYAVLAAPAVAGTIFAIAILLWLKTPPWLPFFNLVTTDGLGIAIVTPAFVSLFQSRFKFRDVWKAGSWLPVALIPVAVLSFCQARVPVIFLIYPMVALILFRFGLGGASVGTIFIAAVGSWFTMRGLGPFAMIAPAVSIRGSVLLELYLASGMFLVFAAASVMETLRATERRLREIAHLHELVTQNSRDVIILADFEGRRSYVSASAAEWGGWKREEILGMKSLDLVHPEDRARAEAVMRNVRSGGEGALFECRAKTTHGNYEWVEANLRPVRSRAGGPPIGILNIVRDISKRKRAERALREAYATLEALVITDPLTRLANRRSFDQCVANEWRRGMRERIPLSLLLIDADWFKSYNDTYGHPQGDSCLKQIAESTLDAVTRPGDLVARIGGEEFAVILPNTPNEGAMQVGKLICSALRRRNIPHHTNPLGYVTVSIGCATVVPTVGVHASTLLRLADEALYAAKHAGRNQVCNMDDGASNRESLQAS